ncbi:molybdopterin-guanine dinucleotide biosynthesis protein B [Lentibacillus cibarius]|uniref:Molybdopterin-guanine dinucleotide biosynthesis protein B n=1 Tax=Lentibacillus cibarius TaxID=2583219 RepID=A0A5S3QMB0_9BACI|nr:molybdopterin-guanine dinucleotide biosynthesis protein B [Lentibacillus cibarius]TMN23092.1 molybdopterin-guanine dinucleotide biosynthesis protein B [Lentibacillus cibarius]
MKICQIAGYKNSGKTTVMNELIRYFSDKGWKVGSLKHHGHGGEPDMTEGTDSHDHLGSGSVISGVQGENITQLTLAAPLQLDELIQTYRQFQLDLLLVEGYKTATYPKIVLLKSEEDRSLLQNLSAIIAVGTWDIKMTFNQDYPVLDMNNLYELVPTLAERIRRDL